MQKVISFLTKLKENNNKKWFDAHKSEYKEVQTIFNDFSEKLIYGISEFDPSIKGLQVKDCTYRIYRDLRFSLDKTPYKTHIGVFVAPHGKCSGHSGYYFHIEQGDDFLSGNMLCTGIYLPQPHVLKSIREEIMLNGQQFVDAVRAAKGFELDKTDSLKKIPKGFPVDSEFAEYLKLKNFTVSKNIDNKFITSDDLLEKTLHEFKKTYQFNYLLNRAVDFALENNY